MSNNLDSSLHQKEFRYGRSKFEYNLIYEDRKNLAITVQPDMSIVVKAPIGSSAEEIQVKLKKRGQWVIKQINYFDKFHPIQPERQYVSGETHYYLGRQYRLRIQKNNEKSVKLVGKFFIVKTSNPNNREFIKLLMMQWYADHARMLLDQRIQIYIDRIIGSTFENLEINYKYLKRRWGSCEPETAITFNIELVKTPLPCIDYVIVHELSHLLHPNHDKAFYRMMTKIIPDWRERKERLELFGLR